MPLPQWFPRNVSEVRQLLVVPLLTAFIVVVSLTYIGSIQANQYHDVVDRIDNNSSVTNEGVEAIVCILRIEPDHRTGNNVGACMDGYNLALQQ